MHRKAVQSKHVHPPKPIIHEIHPKHRIFIHQGWRSEGWVGSGETEARPKPNPSPYAAPMEFGSDSHTLNPDPHTHTHRSTPLPLLLAPLVPSMLAHAPTLVHSFIAHSSSTTAPVFHHFPARISYCAFALTDGIRCGSWRGLDCTRLIDILTRLRIAQCQWRFCGSCVCV